MTNGTKTGVACGAPHTTLARCGANADTARAVHHMLDGPITGVELLTLTQRAARCARCHCGSSGSGGWRPSFEEQRHHRRGAQCSANDEGPADPAGVAPCSPCPVDGAWAMFSTIVMGAAFHCVSALIDCFPSFANGHLFHDIGSFPSFLFIGQQKGKSRRLFDFSPQFAYSCRFVRAFTSLWTVHRIGDSL